MLLAVVLAGTACAQPASGDSSDGAATAEPTAVERTIALTIDDLPVGRGHALAWQQRVTHGLLAQITAADVPVIGFVNEGKLDGDRRADRVALLQAWVDAGHDLGNHTHGHPSLFDTPLEAFQDEVRRGDAVTNRLLAARGDSVRFFRHPFLNTGPDLATKRAFEAWLADEGLTVAPVTHDNSEWIYALAYDRADGDPALRARIADAYLAYMDTTAGYVEALGHDLFGREIAHVLLIHSNALHADHLGPLVDVFRRRGYRFVTLDQALADPAYASDDTYAGRAGISWLQRWALTRDLPFDDMPATDAWVERVAFPNR